MQENLQKMQREAEARVREMQKRAREKIKSPEEKNDEFENAPITEKPSKIKGSHLFEMLNFKSLLKESDTSFVAAILLLLSMEDTDPLLILALIYIIF